MLLYLHHSNYNLFFHPAKFDNFKDEKISNYKTVSVSLNKAGLKTDCQAYTGLYRRGSALIHGMSFMLF